MFRHSRLADAVRLASVFVVLLTVATISQAATVRAVGTSDLTSRSNFVFHGQVAEKWVAAGLKRGSIVTYLRFTVLDVLKGDRQRQSVVLGFLGGTINGRTLRVEGLQVPLVGDEGVFFVERLGGNLAQPFYGWDQGRFPIRSDAYGRKIVVTHLNEPVRQVRAADARGSVASGHAAGIETSNNERDAMTVEAFKLSIRAILETQQ